MAHLFKWLPVCGSDLTIYNTFSSWSASICSSLRSSCLFRDCCDSISRWRLWKNQTIQILKFYVYVIIWISIIWMCMHSILTLVLQWSNYLHVHIKNTRYFSCTIYHEMKISVKNSITTHCDQTYIHITVVLLLDWFSLIFIPLWHVLTFLFPNISDPKQ